MSSRPIDRAGVRIRADHARANLQIAQLALGDPMAGMSNAAASAAVTAAIAAADAITGLALGVINTGDHREQVALLKEALGATATEVKDLSELLASKSAVQYSPRIARASDVDKLVARAARLVESMDRQLRG